MNKNLIGKLDKIASKLESEGHVSLATLIDSVANTLEKEPPKMNIQQAMQVLRKSNPEEIEDTIEYLKSNYKDFDVKTAGKINPFLAGALMTFFTTMATDIDNIFAESVDKLTGQVIDKMVGKDNLITIIGDIEPPKTKEESTGEGIAKRIADATNVEYLKIQAETHNRSLEETLKSGLDPVLKKMNIKYNEIPRVKDLTIKAILEKAKGL
jgi:hypothetical protein